VRCYYKKKKYINNMNTISSVQCNRGQRKYLSQKIVSSQVDISGLAATGHTVLGFTSTSKTYTLSYTSSNPTTLYVLAVGGGGAGGYDNAGGGGAGGVVLATTVVPAGNDTITITIGDGVISPIYNLSDQSQGGTTFVRFTNNPSLNILAGGGGSGTGYHNEFKRLNGSVNGGSGSGTTMSSALSGGLGITANNNLANDGGQGTGQNMNNSGGGGSGTAGFTGNQVDVNGNYGNGGDGVRCTLPGIKDFRNYGAYYWGGGGGGGGYTRKAGKGGLGGGGGGTSAQREFGAPGDVNGINAATNGTIVGGSGRGGANTGGGGGGSGTQPMYGGSGGSGIVLISFL
jgi:hypothetical protein